MGYGLHCGIQNAKIETACSVTDGTEQIFKKKAMTDV